MFRYFTVATDGLTDEQNRALAEAWKPYGWWHWLPNFWLIKDSTGVLSAHVLRDEILRVAPTTTAMVLEVEPKDWGGMFPEVGPQRDWLRDHWPPEHV